MTDIPTLDDCFHFVGQNSADRPELGEVWEQLDGTLVRIVEVSTRFPSVRCATLDGRYAGWRCRDGREVIFGVKGIDRQDLMHRVSDVAP